MYISANTTPSGYKMMATEELRGIRCNGNRIEFWYCNWLEDPDYVYCRNVSEAQYLYRRLCYRYNQELSTGQKVLVNLQVH